MLTGKYKACFGWFLAFGIAVFSSGVATAQNAKQDEKVKIPDPEDITLVTKDKVRLRCIWYPGTNEKKTVPIILLHAWDGSASDHATFARYMQSQFGHAVIVPDLRGHGRSLSVEGVEKEIDRGRMSRVEIASVGRDIDECYKFLKEKNNSGELNIDYLTVIGTRETCIHAAGWAIQDWSWPDLNGIRQGRFVKAVVFIEPEQRFKGLKMNAFSRHPLFNGKGGVNPLSSLVIYTQEAENNDVKKNAEDIYEDLKKYRQEVKLTAIEGNARHVEFMEKESLFKARASGTGAELTGDRNKNVRDAVAEFIEYRVVNANPTAKWKDWSSN